MCMHDYANCFWYFSINNSLTVNFFSHSNSKTQDAQTSNLLYLSDNIELTSLKEATPCCTEINQSRWPSYDFYSLNKDVRLSYRLSGLSLMVDEVIQFLIDFWLKKSFKKGPMKVM